MRDDLYDQINEQEGYYWWHIGRRKLVMKMLNEYWRREKKKKIVKILDLGCGTGTMMKELRPYGKVWGIDINSKALSYCRIKKAGDFLIKADLEKKLSFKENMFDIVICLDVLEHLKNEELVLSEIKRVLINKGIIVITVPAYPLLFSYWDKIAKHYRRYNVKYLKRILKKNNFKIEKMTYYNLFALLPAVVFRLIRSLQQLKIENYSLDFIALPKAINKFLIFLSKVERNLIVILSLPAGLSLFCLARKGEK